MAVMSGTEQCELQRASVREHVSIACECQSRAQRGQICARASGALMDWPGMDGYKCIHGCLQAPCMHGRICVQREPSTAQDVTRGSAYPSSMPSTVVALPSQNFSCVQQCGWRVVRPSARVLLGALWTAGCDAHLCHIAHNSDIAHV
jgi:hypothetical protein